LMLYTWQIMAKLWQMIPPIWIDTNHMDWSFMANW
jgi:hypothetical protein